MFPILYSSIALVVTVVFLSIQIGRMLKAYSSRRLVYPSLESILLNLAYLIFIVHIHYNWNSFVGTVGSGFTSAFKYTSRTVLLVVPSIQILVFLISL